MMVEQRTTDPVLRPAVTRKLPAYLRQSYGGRSRNFFRRHRTALRGVLRAIGEARRGSAWSGDNEALAAAQSLIEKCLEHCRDQ